MRFSGALNSRHLFLYSGFGLILLAFLFLPMRTAVMIGIDLDYYWIGWIFAPVMGAWGLASLALWLSEFSMSRGRVLQGLSLVCVPIYFSLAFAVFMVIYVRVNWSWHLFFALILGPCVIASVAAILYAAKKQKLAYSLKNQRTRSLAFIALIAVPLLYTVIFLLAFTIFS